MIIEIVGKPRAGKTALNTLFMFRELMYNGFLLQRQSRQIISGYNENRELKLGYSKKPPIYSNYEAKIPIGYKKEFKPFVLNPYMLGKPTPDTADKIQNILPCSCLHVTEGRKYWDGRESASMPDNVSQFFETHGHNFLTIIIDAQRGDSLDLNIRKNANKFIEVQGMINDEDAYGRVMRSTWICREFFSLQDYESYLAGNRSAYYRNTTYSFEGNIFAYYESRNRQKDYIPAEGKNYSMLEYVTVEEQRKLPPEQQIIYNQSRPSWYRQKPVIDNSKKVKEQGAKYAA